jgi:hypothetical protein
MTVQELITELQKYPLNMEVGQMKQVWAPRDLTPEFVPFTYTIVDKDTNQISIY